MPSRKFSRRSRGRDRSARSETDVANNGADYIPPSLSTDTIDRIVHDVDVHGDDRYRSSIAATPEFHRSNHSASSASAASSIPEQLASSDTGGTSHSFEEVSPPHAVATGPPVGAPNSLQIMSMSSAESRFLPEDLNIWSDDDYYRTKQKFAYFCIGVSTAQLLLLMVQLAMCGVAPLDINPMVGPFPDAFSEWGGKNIYLMIDGNQWFRLITPAFLHVGVLHLLANAFCQLETCAFFEREWGSPRWLALYILSEAGCVITSCVASPDTVAVGSSGALMGLFGAKLSQVMAHTFFNVNKPDHDDMITLDQLSGVMCSLALVSLLSFLTYIDWSGHMGGLVAGFLGGMVAFCGPIRSWLVKTLWCLLGLVGLGLSGFFVIDRLMNDTERNEQLGDPCDFFRNLFPEGYECECLFA